MKYILYMGHKLLSSAFSQYMPTCQRAPCAYSIPPDKKGSV